MRFGFRLRIVNGESGAPALPAGQGRANDQMRDHDQITQLDQVFGDTETPVILGDFAQQQTDAMLGAL